MKQLNFEKDLQNGRMSKCKNVKTSEREGHHCFCLELLKIL